MRRHIRWTLPAMLVALLIVCAYALVVTRGQIVVWLIG